MILLIFVQGKRYEKDNYFDKYRFISLNCSFTGVFSNPAASEKPEDTKVCRKGHIG